MSKELTEKQELDAEIKAAILDVAKDKEMLKVKSLSRHNPERVAKVLYLSAIGVSQTSIVRKYDVPRAVVISIMVDYADYRDKFRELGGKLSARSYVNLESLEEDVIQSVRERIQTGEYEPSPKDIKEISIAKSNSAKAKAIISEHFPNWAIVVIDEENSLTYDYTNYYIGKTLFREAISEMNKDDLDIIWDDEEAEVEDEEDGT